MTVLKHEMESLETIPENLRPIYAEAGGKYAIPENLRGVADAITGLFQVNSKIRDENKTLLRKSQVDLSGLEEFGEDLPTIKERIKARLAELEEAATKGAESKLNVEKVRQEMKAAMDKAIAEERKVQEALRGTVHRYLVTSGASEALAAEGAIVELAMPFVERQVKVIEQDGEFKAVVVDKDGDPRISGGTGQPMTIRELVREMKSMEMYKPLFKSEAKSGGGALPGKTGAKPPVNPNKELTPIERIKAGLAARKAG
jgi:hypothetical protein